MPSLNILSLDKNEDYFPMYYSFFMKNNYTTKLKIKWSKYNEKCSVLYPLFTDRSDSQLIDCICNLNPCDLRQEVLTFLIKFFVKPKKKQILI